MILSDDLTEGWVRCKWFDNYFLGVVLKDRKVGNYSFVECLNVCPFFTAYYNLNQYLKYSTFILSHLKILISQIWRMTSIRKYYKTANFNKRSFRVKIFTFILSSMHWRSLTQTIINYLLLFNVLDVQIECK